VLALALGSSVAELKARMGHAEFMEWRAYYSIEPFGHARGDLQTGLLASLLANAHRDTKKRPKAYTIKDFLPDYWQQFVEDRSALIRNKFKALFG
jgi:hypothetical protein